MIIEFARPKMETKVRHRVQYRALYEFIAVEDSEELTIRPGDIIIVS